MKKLLSLLLFVTLALGASAQVQNVQTASGANPDVTKPTAGFNLPSGFTLNNKTGATISGAGSYDFGAGTKLVVPNAAAPTTSAFGWLAGDNNAWGASRGALQFFDGTANTYLIGVLQSDTPTNGQVPTWNTGGTITWETGGGTIGGTTGATDNALIRADGTGGSTIQTSTATLSDDAILTLPQSSLAAGTSGDGAVLSTATAATVGAQRFSPRLRLTGNGWKTTATAGSQVVDFMAVVRPIQGAANPTAQLAIASQINAAGFTDRLVIDSGGTVYFGASATAGNITSTSGNVAIAAAGTNQNVNITPIGTGIVSVALATPTVVISDSAATRTYAGNVNATSYGLAVQNTTSNTEFDGLSLGGDVRFVANLASGTYGSLTATGSGRSLAIGFYTYGGTTWTQPAAITINTTQAHTESVRGCDIRFFTTKTGTIVRTQNWTMTNDGMLVGINPTGGVGYATGAGGAVTQGTSRVTGVTLNTITGAITLISAAGSATAQTFTVTDSAVAATDVVVVSQKSGADLYEIFVTNVAAGSFKITFFTTGGTTTEQPVFNFAVIKGAAN